MSRLARPVSAAFAAVFALALSPVAHADVIVDTEDGAPDAVIVGAWTTSTATGGWNGANYLHDGDTGDGTKSVTFTPTLTETRDYAVYARYTSSGNRATNAPYVINYAGGTDTVYVNQTAGGGTWYLLGQYAFDAGTTGNVVLSNTGTDGYVIADAIRWDIAYLDTVTIDNAAASLVGSWVESTSTAGYVGPNYLHDNNTGGVGGKSATFTPDLPSAGEWEVFINYTGGDNRATNVPVDIYHAGGMMTVYVDMETGGGTWLSLGAFDFAAGTGGYAVIRNDGADDYVIADAIEFRQISAIPEPTTALASLALGSVMMLRRRRR